VSTITTTVKSAVHYSEEDRDQMIDTTSKDLESKETVLVKRKTNLCYCVLKLAAHGELYKMLECTEKLSD
jgi:hypothetical protein